MNTGPWVVTTPTDTSCSLSFGSLLEEWILRVETTFVLILLDFSEAVFPGIVGYDDNGYGV